MAEHKKVQLIDMQGMKGVAGHEMTNSLAK
jgi:hypothetical protein